MKRLLFSAVFATGLLVAGSALAQWGSGSGARGFGYGLGGYGQYGVTGYGSPAPTGYGCWRPGMLNGTCGYGTPGRMYPGYGLGGYAGGYGLYGGDGGYGTGYPYYAGYAY